MRYQNDQETLEEFSHTTETIDGLLPPKEEEDNTGINQWTE